MSSLNHSTPRPIRNAPEMAAAVTLLDLIDRPRVGFRGARSAAFLQGRGFSLPDAPNQALAQADGSLVARLSFTEYLLLGGADDVGARIAAEEADWRMDASGNYLLPRQDSHAWLQLSGVAIASLLAKLCGVDLSATVFAPGAVAQTSAARINVIVINSGSPAQPRFEILFDRASLHYFKAAMADAMAEFLD